VGHITIKEDRDNSTEKIKVTEVNCLFIRNPEQSQKKKISPKRRTKQQNGFEHIRLAK
jgi:hypothetical protein